MLKINNKQLAEALKNPNDINNLNLIRKQIRRQFRGIMPKRYVFFPRDPKIYRMSNSICIEMPSWGSRPYRLGLITMEKHLKKDFICDVQYYDGKTTFVVKKWKV